MANPTALRIEAVLSKKEAVLGTDALPVAANGFKVANRVHSLLTFEEAFPGTRPEVVTGSLITAPPVPPVGTVVTADLMWEAKGPAPSAYDGSTVFPEADPVLQACGCSSNFLTAPARQVYAPMDTGHASCTLYCYAGGKLFKIVGCRGNIMWRIRVGQLDIINFRMQGGVIGYADTALLSSIVYAPAANALLAAAAAMTIGSWVPDISEFDFEQGNVLRRLDSFASGIVPGVQMYDFGVATPAARALARVVPSATYDPFTDAGYNNSGLRVARALSLQLGSVAFNKIILAANLYARVQGLRQQDYQDFAAWDIPYLLDSSWTLTFS